MNFLRFARLLPACALLLVLMFAGAPSAAAQERGLQVQIGRPAEGETLYAGPSSLQYNIPINGWAYSDHYDSAQLEVQLDVFQGTHPLYTLSLNPNPDGSFLFNAMINPHNSEEVFPAEHTGCADYCHFPVDLALPPGDLRLRVTATDPSGTQAIDERKITVDLSEMVEIPVRLVLVDGSDHPLQGVQVSASTRLYLWRTRHNLAAAGPDGRLDMPVEALSAAPTHYLLQVEPQLVNGVLYSGIEPAEVTLTPRVSIQQEIVLPVHTQTGRISGQLTTEARRLAEALPVLAFHLPEGTCQQVQSGETGTFAFESLPIGQYLITAGEQELARLDYISQEVVLDLSADPEAAIELPISAPAGRQLAGSVLDANGQIVPFARVQAGDQDLSAAVMPADGAFRLAGLDPQQRSLIASAPGYFSRVLPLSGESSQPLEIMLVRRPETKTLPWGRGEIVIPPESAMTMDDQTLSLAHGWLWGQSGEGEPGGIKPLEILYQGQTLRLFDGRFALGAAPGSPSWFYLFEGQAELQSPGGAPPVPIYAGQMVSLDGPAEPQPVAYRVELVAGLQAQQTVPALDHHWQPGIQAVVRDRLASLGIGVAQLLTFITAMLITLAVISGPLLIGIGWLKYRRRR